MAKKATNKKANMAKEENIKDTVLDVEKTENVENTALDTEKDEDTENTILGVEKKDSDIIRKELEEDTSNVNNEDEQKPTEDNAKIDFTTFNNKIIESVRIGKGKKINKENEDSQSDKKNSADKINTAKHNILKLFGYYWNGQLMD